VVGLTNVNILFHSLRSFVENVVQLASTFCQDAKFVFFMKLQPHVGSVWKGAGCKYSCDTRMLLKVSISGVMIKDTY